MKVLKKDIGKFALVKYDDVGLREELIVDSGPRYIRTFDGEHMHWAEPDQIKKIGNYLAFKDTGIKI